MPYNGYLDSSSDFPNDDFMSLHPTNPKPIIHTRKILLRLSTLQISESYL